MRVLYFAWLRERIGVAEEEIAPPASVRTVADLIAHLSASSPRHAHGFSRREAIRCAVNQDLATPDTPVAAGDEIAFFPPVTGG
jgi:molybdopterin converting factor subunit 1